MDRVKENIDNTFELLDRSYSPYSNICVACSIITNNKQCYGGINIENASYGLTMCAERCAIYNAISNGLDTTEIDYIIIVTDCIDNLYPCGACLQVFSEFLRGNTKIFISSFNKQNSNTFTTSQFIFNELLPKAFLSSRIQSV
jgi:cytidine deaminase